MKPGKGGAFVRTTLKNLRTGAVVDKTFRAGEKVEQAHRRQARDAVPVPRRRRLRLHGQRHLRPAHACRRSPSATAAGYIVDGSTVQSSQMHGDEIVGTDSSRRRSSSPSPRPSRASQGDRVSGATKPATLETGAVVQVPLFVNVGDRIKVDTRSASTSRRRSAVLLLYLWPFFT